jgi:DNA processing protein
LVERGVVVVSGLAEGVDTAAHLAAITGKGKTIAVIGTPLDRVYPKQNAGLQKRIAEEHLLVSPFSLGFPVRPGNFPLRNRTMALLSDATVIIEATDTSSSLHQGWEALRLGRLLFITNSTVQDPALTWPRKMLDHGARILSDETLEDLFDLLPARMAIQFDGGAPF